MSLSIFNIADKSRKWISKRVSAVGNILWENSSVGGEVITDVQGNAIFKTFVQISNTNFDFFVQRLNINGGRLWNSSVLFSKTGGSIMTDDAYGGVIIIWTEIGANSRFGIFAQQVSRNGNLGEVLSTSVSESEISSVPTKYILHQSYPNPFNSSMVIKYEISKRSFVQLKILDVSGKEVIKLVNKEQGLGKYTVVWNSKDEKGGEVVSGIYFYQLRADNFVETRKALFIQ